MNAKTWRGQDKKVINVRLVAIFLEIYKYIWNNNNNKKNVTPNPMGVTPAQRLWNVCLSSINCMVFPWALTVELFNNFLQPRLRFVSTEFDSLSKINPPWEIITGVKSVTTSPALPYSLCFNMSLLMRILYMQCTLDTFLVYDPVASARFCDSGSWLNGWNPIENISL